MPGNVSYPEAHELVETVKLISGSLSKFYPPSPSPKSALENPTTGAMRSSHDYKRQLTFLEKAEQNGHTVLRGEMESEKNRMGISLVVMKNGVGGGGDNGGLMDEEIFGPVLPIIPVDVSLSPIFISFTPSVSAPSLFLPKPVFPFL